LVLSSPNVDVWDLSNVIIESLSQLSLVPSTKFQEVSPGQTPSNISKLVYESEEKTPFGLTREILLDYQGWYCDMQEDRSESITKDLGLKPIVSPGVFTTLAQVAINPNLPPMVERACSSLCTPL